MVRADGRVGWSEEVLEDEAPEAQDGDDLFSMTHNEREGVERAISL